MKLIQLKFEKNVWWQTVVVVVGLIAGAKLRLEAGIIPFTLQTFSLALTCLFFSRQANLFGTFIYMMLGIGLPVFADDVSYGNAVYKGATAGYIYGFPFAAIIISNARAHIKDWFAAFSWVLMGHAVILVFGAAWVYFYLHWTLDDASQKAFFSFLPGAIIKSVSASLIYWLSKKYYPAKKSA